ncbi:MAG TPA: hypothetical protein VHB25_20295 [Gemmatimonadaceae bacterium]|nr:hypothetical protein [Gemmatimonadaceae bacterium]
MGSGERRGIARWLAVLFTIAVVTFFLLGDAIAHRDAHASEWAGIQTRESTGEVETPGSSTHTPATPANPLELLARGVAASANTAAMAMTAGGTTAGAVALDAAMRAADVGRGVGAGAARTAFDSAFRMIQRARTQRQNGNPTGAAATVRAVDRVLAAAPAATAALPSEPSGYDGARLLNAAGTMIGVVDHVSTASSGQAASATVVLGGYHHVLGFLDFGGAKVTVPTSMLVFGDARALGPTRVVLATMATRPDDIRRELSAPAR